MFEQAPAAEPAQRHLYGGGQARSEHISGEVGVLRTGHTPDTQEGVHVLERSEGIERKGMELRSETSMFCF